MQKLAKVKVTDKFSFPLTMDFTGLVSEQHQNGKQTANTSHVYDLAAILIHKGGSASHGHYGELP